MNSTENKVMVVADENGNTINVSVNNPEYGYIRIEQTSPSINQEGWIKIQKKSCLLKGKIVDLQLLSLKEGDSIPGKLIVKESFIPFSTVNAERNLKYAGNTGVICRVDDQPIYREVFYTTDVNEQDIYIQHTNREEIKAALEVKKSNVKLFA